MRDREKLLNLPEVVSALLGVMAAIQLFATIGPTGLVDSFFNAFAFIPLRLSFLLAPARMLELLGADAGGATMREDVALMLSGGPFVWATPLTYAFLHANWTHLVINGLTLIAFGAPVAQRLGAHIFLWFFCACAIAGAMAHYALHPLDTATVVGASAAISGTMAAILRFAFSPGAGLGRHDALQGRESETLSLSQLGGNKSALLFLVVWFGANFFFGAFPELAGSSDPIAWEAHVGGFLFGLLTFGAFDRWARRA